MTIHIRPEYGVDDRRSYDCDRCDLVISMAPRWWSLGRRERRVCGSCLLVVDLEPSRDSTQCPRCGTAELQTPFQLVGQRCPRCKEGIFTRTGRPPETRFLLDPGWEELPLPALVRDLVQHTHRVHLRAWGCPPPALPDTLVPPAFMHHVKIPSSAPLPAPEAWTWSCLQGVLADLPVEPDDPPAASLPPLLVEGLPSILRAVPELDALLVMEGDTCRWRDEVAPPVRRGIRNLARKIDMDLLTRKSMVMAHTRGEKWMVVGSGLAVFVAIWLLSVVALTWGGFHWYGAWGGLAGLLLSLVCGALLPRLLIRIRNLFP